jgi:hypothetical protein
MEDSGKWVLGKVTVVRRGRILLVSGVLTLTGATQIVAADGDGQRRTVQHRLENRLAGTLRVLWGDPRPDAGEPARTIIGLEEAGGRFIELDVAEHVVRSAGGLTRLDGRRAEVAVEGEALSFRDGAAPPRVRSIRLLPSGPAPAKAVTGSKPWTSIPCRFAGDASEPQDLGYFQGMYSSSYPGLDHYWREVSYDQVNVAGSSAVDWVQLPHPSSHYAYEQWSEAQQQMVWVIDLDGLFDDCTAAADPHVNYPDFVGINMMFNDTFGPWAWGGRRCRTLDGRYACYSVTWEPPWGYYNSCVMAH